MTKLYVVTYDFAEPDSDRYAAFSDALAASFDWWHWLKDTWLVATDLTAAEVFGKLRPLLDDRVNILVLEAGRDVAGYLPKKAWPWIEERLNGAGPVAAMRPEPAQLAPVPTT